MIITGAEDCWLTTGLYLRALVFLIFCIFPVNQSSADEIQFSSCECDTIDLSCSNSLVIEKCGPLNLACARGCSVIVTESVCKQHKLKGGEYSVLDLNKHLSCNFQEIKEKLATLQLKNKLTLKEVKPLLKRVENCGSLIHELTHACISKSIYTHKALACEEWGAHQVEKQIYTQAFKALCQKENKKPKIQKASKFCSQLCIDALGKDVNSEWLSCACEMTDQPHRKDSDWLNTSECCSCYQRCREGKLTKGKDWLPKYCQEKVFSNESFKKKLESNLEYICKTMAFSKNHYSCQRLSRFGNNPNNSCQ